MIGPYTTVELGDGRAVDLYLLRFDKNGRLLSPRTQALLLQELRRSSDVFVFSHGWNNTFDSARDKYLDFITGYAAQRARVGLPVPSGYRPLLVGVIWPATSFVLPWEQGPEIAGTGPQDAEREEMLHLLGEDLPPEQFAALTELVDGVEAVDEEQAHEAARLVLSSLTPGDDPEDAATPPTPEELVDSWRALEGGTAPAPPDPDDFGAATTSAAASGPGQPTVAGGGRLDPRGLLRTATVWQMKDRAGTVGGAGVAGLLERVLDDSDARLHLVGHSFGARVVLSAAAAQRSARPIQSVLLLQPAVNRWCFAHEVIDRGVPGGYRPVLDKVVGPVVTTYSRHDRPLHEAFHLAVRGSHLGEPDIAAVGDTHRYGALGGYGPAGIDDLLHSRKAMTEGAPYDLDRVTGVVQVDGDVPGVKRRGLDQSPEGPAIAGHGDINSTVTWWALHALTG
ncbi:hypothetical protein [Ornithinicoccus halotolerans]|uniref:hypothetical protein n=1 Tax=Ornithinicoccus halotolerans TaxID=1748220 RepID=UPI001296A4FC|nr:hypothetical protein [Ornithinicoccus halotolerans]